jgi:formate dehydrogenase major subunit
VAALAESLGRGAMTNHWIDIGNSDCILIMGANPAENHPISFKWVNRAQGKGAMVIHVDPRFTRTSAKADIHAPIRPGTDIAFLGGMIKYAIDNRRYFPEYVARYTNAGFILRDDFSFHDGLFSGYDPKQQAYDPATWALVTDEHGVPVQDPTLTDPQCVFRQLRKHFNRYDPDTVSTTTGTPAQLLEQIYDVYTSTGCRDKAGTIMYAMGWTQHTTGVQIIRAMCMIQLLLGNVGIAGGGVNALRGESNVQGSTDHGLLWHTWPGYLKTPSAPQSDLKAYNTQSTPLDPMPRSANWWNNYPKYSVSFLKSMFGDAATPENDFGYSWLPKAEPGKTYSWLDLFDDMFKGHIKGFFAWGQNPACSGANAEKTRTALTRLEWLVNVNLFDNETGSFWMGPGLNPEEINTEVFFLPCAASLEKEGSITNSGRWSQWRYKAQDSQGEARPDGDIVIALMERIRTLYRNEGGVFQEPIINLKWDYETNGRFDAHKAAREINGYFQNDVMVGRSVYKKGDLVPNFMHLQDDGGTSSGNWLYCGSYTADGNMSARRNSEDSSGIGLFSDWAWSWPLNRRILYNRASVDPQGRPWDKTRPLLRFDGHVENGKYVSNRWVGDIPDGGWYPLQNPDGSDRNDAKLPFIMLPTGHARIYGPGLKDGPFPEHYEPLECPVDKNLFSTRMFNPAAPIFGSEADRFATCDPRFPYVGTTYRVTEHWQTGVMTRWLPWLLETEPQSFAEISVELAATKNIRNGEKIRVVSARGHIEAVAVVTSRIKPFFVQNRDIHLVGLPWCFGWLHPVDGGDSANLLTPSVGDPNTRIPETKSFMVNITKTKG